jgi:hypothetical protein
MELYEPRDISFYRVVSDGRLEDETLRHRLARRTTATRAS